MENNKIRMKHYKVKGIRINWNLFSSLCFSKHLCFVVYFYAYILESQEYPTRNKKTEG
jgi:hypothetical protein